MPEKNDNYSDDLAQIHERQMAVLEEIDEIRERHGILPPEIEKIQRDALSIVHDIDQLRERNGQTAISIQEELQ